jgi:Holliday junction resolvase
MPHGMPRKVDANHREIVDALVKAGCPVIDISALGGGAPDIIVLRRDKSITLFEIKNPERRWKLNKLQESWHLRWAGSVHVVTTVDQALRLAGAIQ